MQNLKLQVLWLDSSLGLAVNQKTPKGNIPLTSYYFWPVSEAWEQIQFELNSKPWIRNEERVRILNLVVDVMNEWQTTRNLLTTKTTLQENKDIPETFSIVGLP